MEESRKSLHDRKILVNFEIALVVAKNEEVEEAEKHPQEDAVKRLMRELENRGLVLDIVHGIADKTFIKVGAPVQVLGRAAERLKIKKPTYIGMDIQFDWKYRDAFVRQPDSSLFSWPERYHCLNHLIYGVVNETGSPIKLIDVEECREIEWNSDEPLIVRLKTEGIVKEVFPLHDEKQKKELLQKWAYRWLDFSSQPIDSIYSYFGAKVATYFSFLGMYTKWILFPAALGILFHSVNFGSWQLAVLPIFSILAVSWAVLFLQFWKRQNAALQARWSVNHSTSVEPGSQLSASEQNIIIRTNIPDRIMIGADNIPQYQQRVTLQRNEWHQHFKSFRNNAIVISGILCLQLPFELVYAHLNYTIQSQIFRYALTALYLLAIQYYTKFGEKISVRLVETQHYDSREARADSLVYKVFGLYFMQSYIGLFYTAIFHRDIVILQQILIQRLIVSMVLNNLSENLIPYVKYRYTKYNALKKHDRRLLDDKSKQHMQRIEKEYMRPSYTASIGNGLEDGLFDDFLELALQFGMVTMFACTFPFIFVFAAANNFIEIRTDSLKLLGMLRRPVPRAVSTIGAWLNIFQLLGMLRRPVPRAVSTIGAWLNIFQFLAGMAICTNCALLVCFYDQAERWKIEPGLAAILLMEHVLLLIKFGIACLVPEEPTWVRANRMRHAQARDSCSQQLLENICKPEKKIC